MVKRKEAAGAQHIRIEGDRSQINHHGDANREDREKQVQAVRQPSDLDEKPKLVRIAIGPAGERPVLRPGDPQLGDAADHLQQKADDLALDLLNQGFLANLAAQEDQNDQKHRAQQQHAQKSQPPAIPEDQPQVEQRDQARHKRCDGCAGDLLEDQRQAQRPQRQVAGRVLIEEAGGQAQEPIPDGGDHGGHHLTLDPNQGQPLDDLEHAWSRRQSPQATR